MSNNYINLEELKKGFKSEEELDKQSKIEVFKKYQEEWFVERAKQENNNDITLSNKIIYNYDLNVEDYRSRHDLIYPLIDMIPIEDLKQSKIFIFQIMTQLNAFCKEVVLKDIKNKHISFKRLTEKKMPNGGKHTVITKSTSGDKKRRIRNLEDLISEIDLYAYDGDSYEVFSPFELIKQLKGYREFLHFGEEKYNYEDGKKHKDELEEIVRRKFNELGIKDYSENLTKLRSRLTKKIMLDLSCSPNREAL